jgi:hypothetical protein
MTIAGQLSIDKTSGKLQGPAGTVITYNDPFPLAFSRAGVTGQMDGVVLHTMVGTIESAIQTFNSPNAQGSAHIGISQAGRIHQFVPIGQGYETFHAFAANLRRYGIETEDDGRPQTPISDAGLWAWAQCLEFLSRFAGFPLQVTDDCNGRGLAYHRMCQEWNLSTHSCPGASFTDMERVNQRDEIVKRAKQIREGQRPSRTPGHIAYAAHGAALAWGDGTGTKIPFWADASDAEHAAWEAAAKAAAK